MRIALALCALVFVLPACSVVNKFDYAAPDLGEAMPTHEVIVDQPFDDTWRALISKIGQTFFAIDHFEKDSGLLTLTFTANPLSSVVDGGQCKVVYDDSSLRTAQAMWANVHVPATKIRFEGNYADYVDQYLSGTFAGKVNLVVQPEGASRTRVTVNTRFVVTATAQVNRSGSIVTVNTTWSWNAGDRAVQVVETSKGGREERIMQSTGYVEREILSAIEDIN